MGSLERIIAERPKFHAAETEIQRAFDAEESLLPQATATSLADPHRTCYGIGEDVLRFISDTVRPGHRTLETGAGCSTLVFALCNARHTAVTPSKPEAELIQDYANKNGISLASVRFVSEPSERYLPRSEDEELDVVLLDGKHAFPWPIVDWFFTADRLKRGGTLILDDAHMRSVSLLVEFISSEPGWELTRDFGGKTVAFRKLRDQVLDVAWHMQPWTVAPIQPPRHRGMLERIRGRIAQLIRPK